MILRGDGQSNLICEDFLAQRPRRTPVKRRRYNCWFYEPSLFTSQKQRHCKFIKLCFIRHLLNSITEGGRAAVIVPVSAMIGKTKDDKAIKKEILKNHTLEGVISLNKDTFYRVGTVPCIAVFTTGIPHPTEKSKIY
ncbi:MAG: N-6 DNA methylase [Anaerobutyricum soehngenii]